MAVTDAVFYLSMTHPGSRPDYHSPTGNHEGGVDMADVKEYPYETRLDVLCPPLEVIDEKALASACTHKWYNQTLCAVNDSVVRLGVVQGEYHWHKHDADDEFFYVVEGRLLIDLEGRTVELAPRQGVVIPKGVMHRPRAPERTVMLMVETSAIVPTGN
jgi:mannose-6-phosphate isomerase-like protein (cupin superfamily)